jgi:GDP-L-fucose synthase
MAPSELPFRIEGSRICVAGHRGMVGSALVRRLAREDCEVLTVDRNEVDLRRPADVQAWMHATRPDAVILAAARVGGIHANASRPADFLDDNLTLQTNVIHTAAEIGVRKLLSLGSSCIYPRLAPQPIPESALLTGPLEPTNQWYAIAKIAGLMQCQAHREQHGCDFISAMPTNLYGPGDNFDVEGAHVLPALPRRFRAAALAGDNKVTIWGTGTPRREFLHVDDCANALVFLLRRATCRSLFPHQARGFRKRDRQDDGGRRAQCPDLRSLCACADLWNAENRGQPDRRTPARLVGVAPRARDRGFSESTRAAK